MSVIEEAFEEIAEAPTLAHVNIAAGAAYQRLREQAWRTYALWSWRVFITFVAALAIARWFGYKIDIEL